MAVDLTRVGLLHTREGRTARTEVTMTAPGYFPGPSAGGQTAAQVQQAITNTVPLLIPPATSSRLWTMPAPQTGDTIQATTTETPFASRWTCPANSLMVGQSIRMWGRGQFTTTAIAAPNQRARVRFGGVLLIDSGWQGLILSATTARYDYDVTLVVRAIGVNGSIEAAGRLEFTTALGTATAALVGPSGTATDVGNPVTVDTTQAADLTLSVQFSAATASNSNALRTQNIHTLRPVS